MENSIILQQLLHGNQLKRTVRTGWAQRGIANAEDVAAHTYGVSFTVLILAQIIERPLDLEKALIMAILHDLPEGITTDIPTPVWHVLPVGIKTDVEREAMKTTLSGAPFESSLMTYWEELHRSESLESLLVHDADKLDMYIQALMYEKQTGNQQLSEFWLDPHIFHYSQAQKVFDELVKLRAG